MKNLSVLFILLLLISLSNAGYCGRKYEFSEDLNGNGKKENITVTFTGEKDRDIHNYIITINNDTYEGSFPYDGVVSAEIIDIDKNDNQRELLIRFDGETDDIIDCFFRYKDGILKIGEIAGASQTEIPGYGTTSTFQWMGFWGREAKFNLENFILVPVVEEYELKIESTVSETMVLSNGPSGGSGISATLEPKTKIKLIKATVFSDRCTTAEGFIHDCEWYYIESENGEKGWIEYGDLIKATMDLPWAG